MVKKKRIKIDNCLVGEPTNLNILGDQIKIGRRGGYNGIVTVYGKEGHSAWPNRTKNPVSALIKMMAGKIVLIRVILESLSSVHLTGKSQIDIFKNSAIINI